MINMDELMKDINKHLHELAMDDYYGEDDEDIDWYDI